MKTKYCSNCGKKIDTKAEICPKCGVRVAHSREKIAKEVKSSGLAAVLSFILPGLGQIYNGQIGKGLLFIILLIVSVLSILILIGIILLPVFWIYNIYDAYDTAKKINAGEIKV